MKKLAIFSLLALCCFTSCEVSKTPSVWIRVIKIDEVLTVSGIGTGNTSLYYEGSTLRDYRNGYFTVDSPRDNMVCAYTNSYRWKISAQN